jgi:sulfur carrier protein
MQIQLNGNPLSLDKITTIQDLLDDLNLSGRLAVEVNHQIVPRSLFQSHRLNAGDNIEIVHAIGGG